MFWMITAILLVLWGLGMVGSHTLRGGIHLVLAIGAVALLLEAIKGRRAVS